MAIKIPNWVKNTWTWFASVTGALAATALVVSMPHEPEQFNRQIVVGQDSTITIENGDTTKRVTTENDLTHMKIRAAEQYDDGFRLHVWEYKTINTLTGEVTPEVLLTVAPPIGTQVVWWYRGGAGEVAREKIPEKLEGLGSDSLAAVLGWYPVMDTVETDTAKTVELRKRWVTDVKVEPTRVEYVAPTEEVLGEISR